MTKLALLLLVAGASTIMDFVEAGGHGHGHHHVIIHVPYKIKTIHHTHTITKHVHHKEGGGDKYEVLGYTVGHPIDLGHHGLGHGSGESGHDFGGGDWSGGMSGMSEGIKGGEFEGSFEGGHLGGYETHGGGDNGLGGHEFSAGGYEGHEEYGGH